MTQATATTIPLTPVDPPGSMSELAMAAVSIAFGSLGRVCMALDAGFRIRHVSSSIDELLGVGSGVRWRGQPVEGLVGDELLGPAGPLRLGLLAGERREGWRAWVRVEPSGTRLCSVTVAPIRKDASGVCDPTAVYLLVLRPAEEDEATRGTAPTSFGGLIARSKGMLRVMRLVQSLQHSEATVLLAGESGTGKGLLARAIHDHSPRHAGPFVAVNCAALPENLLETELFGHVRGAFTGAIRDRVGRFELAAGGTLFLDEVGDLPLHLQAKLLRALQERTFERVGESRPVDADVRIVAASHRDLRRAVDEGRFREDLYYRLRVFPIEIPPLRERREDVEPVARYLLARVGARSGRELRFSPEALRELLEYPWPGNVRELENALEYASTVAQGQTLQPEDLPPEVVARRSPEEPRDPAEPSGPAMVSPLHLAPYPAGQPQSRGGPPPRASLEAALETRHWRIAEAAADLGVSRTTLWRWMREHRLSR